MARRRASLRGGRACVPSSRCAGREGKPEGSPSLYIEKGEGGKKREGGGRERASGSKRGEERG
eukprot:scaffold94687_cov29-Tisochrysis_lutea.AAC.1